jgi:hypothetical protein
MDSLEASHAAKRRRLALADGVKGQMELDALWSQLLWFELRSDLGEMEHRIALASAGGPHAMQAMEVSESLLQQRRQNLQTKRPKKPQWKR